ncbi:MAG: asparagine synthase (glutamine-hydrolyzing) [Deltaproteobacteria bacterium]|nr:asparagine synthase (glutamine-hydrolyzing) [Deltaproteobacteria bacterium]
MCGIAGVLEFKRGKSPSSEGLRRMARVMTHRGPDEEGFYQSGPMGLAHRRLKIIDLVSGQQPMQSPDRRVCLVLNGEIYNYPELKEALEKDGYAFRTQSDTEVLLALYLRVGLEAFAKINGMFACAFWDERSRELILARDRLGKKPLFYYHDEERFLFGSELKALLAYGGIERNVSLIALRQYLTYGYTAGEETFVEGIRRLPSANVLVVRDGRLRQRSYWELKFHTPQEPVDENAAVERLDGLLRQAVRRRLLSDVPLGAFLSGGLDSSTVAAYMAEASGRPVKTFTIGFEESSYSEIEDAKVVARHLGTEHYEMVVRPSALEILPDLVWHLDEPFADSSAVPTYYVCKAAREHVTVALSGDGGDEIFAGYLRYQEMERYQKMQAVPAWIRRGLIRPLTQALPFTAPGWNYLYAVGHLKNSSLPGGLGLYPYIEEELYTAEFRAEIAKCEPFQTTEKILSQARHLDPISRHQYLDTLHYLPGDILMKVDRMSMANSLEVRSPLLDYTLVEYVAGLPLSMKVRNGVSKYIFRKLARRSLPSSVLTKRKQGFAVPKDRWFQSELRGFAEEILLEPKTVSRGYFRKTTLERILRHHSTGRRDYSTWIWALIVLEMWFRTFVESSSGGIDGRTQIESSQSLNDTGPAPSLN